MTYELVAIVTLSLAGFVAVFALFARKTKEEVNSQHGGMKFIGGNRFGQGREVRELYKTKLETGLERFEGAEAIYRERDTIARVRVHNIKLTELRIDGDIELLSTAGLASPAAGWHFSAVWDLFSVTDSEWIASPPINVHIYYDSDVIRQVTAIGATREAGEPDILHLMKLRQCLNESSEKARRERRSSP